MPNGYLSAQNVHHIIQVGAVFDVIDPGTVPLVYLIPGCAVGIVDVQEIALKTPAFPENLCPFCLRIYLGLQIEGQFAIAQFRHAIGFDDSPGASTIVQQLLAVMGSDGRIDRTEENFCLAVFKIVAVQGRALLIGHCFLIKNVVFGPCNQSGVVAQRHIDGQNPLLNAINVNVDGNCGVFCTRFSLGFRFGLFFIAFGQKW